MGIVAKQSIIGTIVAFIGAFIGFLTTFYITTKFLSPEEIGLTRVIFEAGMLISTFSLLGTASSAIRYYPYFKTDDGKDKGFFSYLIIITLIGGLIFIGLYLLFKSQIISYFSRGSKIFGDYYYFVIPMIIFLMYQTLLEVYASLKQRVVGTRITREILIRLLLIIVYLVYGLCDTSLTSLIIMFVGAYGITAFTNLAYCYHLAPQSITAPPHPIRGHIIRDFIKYTSLTLLAALTGNIVSRIDLFMVSSQMGFEYGGIYTIAFFIVAIIEIPARSITAMSSPLVSIAMKEENHDEVKKLMNQVSHHQLLIGGIFFLMIWINIDTLFYFIPNSAIYQQGKWVVFYLGIAKLMEISFAFGNAILRYSKYYPWSILFGVLMTSMTIILNYYFITLWGMTGAAIATLVTITSSYTLSQVLLITTLKVTPINIDMIKIILLLSAVMIVEHILPHYGSPIIDSLWRSTVLMVPMFGILSQMRISETLKRELLYKLIKRH